MDLYCPECGAGYQQGRLCPVDGATLRSVEGGEDPWAGRLIHGRFRLIEELGRGGAGTVYRAIQRPIGREVAVKVLHDSMGANQTERERFMREARLATSLRHPGIVSPVDFGEDPEFRVLYFAMEYLQGVDLRVLLKGPRRLRLDLALEIIYQVAGALTEAHDKGIVHRDLKPGNIRLVPVSDGSLQVKILDLGIARTLEGSEDITTTGNITGAVAYLPPEYMVEGIVCPPSDFYSLGIIFHEMIVGRRPFTGNYTQLMFQHIKVEAPALTAGLRGEEQVPPQVERFYRRLVAKDPSARVQSARELREHIKELRQRLKLPGVHLDEELWKGEARGEGIFQQYLRSVGEESGDDAPEISTGVREKLKEAATSLLREPPEPGVTPKPRIKLTGSLGIKERLRERLREARAEEGLAEETPQLADNWGILEDLSPAGLAESSQAVSSAGLSGKPRLADNWDVLPDPEED